jgi:TatD DNase family protein|tara:strand:+ start:501 stop:1337 length:837 start_codon:yes stop_codon:yes gene_type:complete
MLIDTHCHLSFKAFDDDWEDVVKRASKNDIQMICVGAAKETSEKSITIAKKDGVFASIGIHPTHVEDESFSAKGRPASGWDQAWFSKQADNPKVVAIGETGIDHYHLDRSRRSEILGKQEELLRQHLALAKVKDLPVILHSRDGKTESTGEAYGHLYGIIKEFGYTNCVKHCFGSNWEYAKKFLDLGIMLSFTGIVTFKNASDDLLEVVKRVPKDRFMIETDSPYLAPEPMRGKQNEPSFVEYVARGIAEIRGEEYSDVAQYTTKNALKFFSLSSRPK